MGILLDKNFESSEISNEKVNDIIATVSFIDGAMGNFIENSVLREIYDISDELSKQPEIKIDKVVKLPNNKVVYWIVKEMSYGEKLKICKKIAPSLFSGHGCALEEMVRIRNRVAHEWFRGAAMTQQDKEAFAKIFEEYSLDGKPKDINDEYNDFQKLYNKHRDFILTLEQETSSEHLGLHK